MGKETLNPTDALGVCVDKDGFTILSIIDRPRGSPGSVWMKAVTSSTLHWDGAGWNVLVGADEVNVGADALLARRAARRSILAVMATAGSSSMSSSSSSSRPPSMSSSSSSSSPSSSAAAFSFPSFSRRPALQRSRGCRIQQCFKHLFKVSINTCVISMDICIYS